MRARRDGSRIGYQRIAREITQPISGFARLPGVQAEKQFGGHRPPPQDQIKAFDDLESSDK